MAKSNKRKKAPTKKPKSVASKALPNWMTRSAYHLLVVGVVGFLLYANTLTHNYTQDDAIVITENMYTTQGLKGIPGILNKDTFYGFFKEEGKAFLVSGGRYRPLTLVLFAMEWEVFGKNPVVSHAINVLLFVLTSVLLYRLLVLLFSFRFPRSGTVMAFLATLLFVVHPVHVEVVANIKGADEIVALLGSLGAFYLVLRADVGHTAVRLLLAAIVFFLGLMSKENTITFLAIIPVGLILFKDNKLARSLQLTWPLVVSTIMFLVIRGQVIGWQFGGKVMELMNNPFLKVVNGRYVDFSFSEKFGTIIYTLGDYLRLLVFPYPLTHDYYPKHVGMMDFGDWQVILSVLGYAGLVYLAVKFWTKKPLVSFGIFFFIASLSIVSNIVFPVGTFMAERFLFMPSVGFSIVLAYVTYTLYQRFGTAVLGVFGLILVLFSVKTVDRNRAWKDNFTLFTTDVKVSKNSAKIRNSAGGALLDWATKETNPDKQRTMREQAVAHLREAVKIHPTYKNAWLLLGNGHNYLQQYDESVNAYKNALRVAPEYQEAKRNLALTYRMGGQYWGETKGDLAKALQYLLEAEKLEPENSETIRLLGIAYAVSGQMNKAIPYMEKALAAQPDNANLLFDLGTAYQSIGNQAKANELHQQALAIDPELMKKRQQ